MLMSPPEKKREKKNALTRKKTQKHKNTKTPPKNNKNTKKHPKKTNFFFSRSCAKKTLAQKKTISHVTPSDMKPKRPLCNAIYRRAFDVKKLVCTAAGHPLPCTRSRQSPGRVDLHVPPPCAPTNAGLVFLLVVWVLAGACQMHGVGVFLLYNSSSSSLSTRLPLLHPSPRCPFLVSGAVPWHPWHPGTPPRPRTRRNRPIAPSASCPPVASHRDEKLDSRCSRIGGERGGVRGGVWACGPVALPLWLLVRSAVVRRSRGGL